MDSSASGFLTTDFTDSTDESKNDFIRVIREIRGFSFNRMLGIMWPRI
jgi:hypothetical protein